MGANVCFRCRKPGHWSKECPLNGQNPEETSKMEEKVPEVVMPIQSKTAEPVKKSINGLKKAVEKKRAAGQQSIGMFFKK